MAQHFISEEIKRRLKTGRKGVEWINMNQNGEKWRNAAKTVREQSVPQHKISRNSVQRQPR
jgi:hypothetical protein